MYKELCAFFMTGTGNSYLVAAWAIEAAKIAGVQAIARQVDNERLQIRPQSKTLYAFSFPTHGFTAPWLLIRQILQLPRGQGAAAVVLPTRAGTRICGVMLPGMEGTAGYLAAFLLLLKGYTVRGVKAFDMPSNWTALHWGLNKENTECILSATKPRVHGMITDMLAGKRRFSGFIPLGLGLGLASVSVMYVLLAQFILAKLFFASTVCVGCGLCSRLCPRQAIRMTGKPGNAYPYWTYSCDSCMACMNYCPYQAIEASPLLAVIFYYLVTVPAGTYLLDILFGGAPAWLTDYGLQILQYVYCLIAVFLAYRFLHLAMGWMWFRRVFSQFTHTRYFRRYRAPSLTADQLIRMRHNHSQG